jgi:hypothetical protein
MPKTYSTDMRARVIARVESGASRTFELNVFMLRVDGRGVVKGRQRSGMIT